MKLISYYDLLGMIKEGNIPILVYWEYRGEKIAYVADYDIDNSFLGYSLQNDDDENDTVRSFLAECFLEYEMFKECIEIPNDDFEDIKPLVLKTFGRTGEAVTIDRFEDYSFDNFRLLEDTLSKVILNQKKIIEQLKNKG